MPDKIDFIDARPEKVFHARDEARQERVAMGVEITVNWHFVGRDEEAQVAYRPAEPTPPPGLPDASNGNGKLRPGRVVPLSSSVLAPGLSMPVPR
jgi:hypothetical protein